MWGACTLTCGSGVQKRARMNIMDFDLPEDDERLLSAVDTKSCSDPCPGMQITPILSSYLNGIHEFSFS